MSNADIMKEMLNLAKAVVSQYDKMKAIKVLDGLSKWIVGDVTVSDIECIAMNGVVNRSVLDTSYDSDITSNLTNIYSTAASRGEYNVLLIESAIRTKRCYRVVSTLSKFDWDADARMDVYPYVNNDLWSDSWIEHIIRNYANINKAYNAGYNIMRVFTPEHNPNIFDTVCYKITDDTKVVIPIDWIKNTHYGAYEVSNLIDLYHENPYFDWASVITPDVCGFAVQEVVQTTDRDLSKDSINRILDYWSKVTPKLEYALMDGNDGLSLQQKREMYERCKARYGYDGDELAGELFDDKYPERVAKDSEYWHSVHDAGGTNQFLDALRLMQGGM